MTIQENFENGKISKKKLPHVLKLVEMDLDSLLGCYLERNVCLEKEKECFSFNRIGFYDYETLMKISSTAKKLAIKFEYVFNKNAKDLFEFFYDEKVTEEKGYYSFQFPIDLEKFKKLRVPKDEVGNTLGDIEKNGKKLCDYMEKIIKFFENF